MSPLLYVEFGSMYIQREIEVSLNTTVSVKLHFDVCEVEAELSASMTDPTARGCTRT